MKFNLNRLLKLQIRGKLAIAFVGLSVIPVLMLGILGISSNITSMRKTAYEALSHDLLTIRERLNSFFQGTEENIRFLTGSSSFHHFVESLERDGGFSLLGATEEVVSDLVAYARRKGVFYQVKFVDSDGNELFGIEDRRGSYVVLDREELNRTGTRFYLYLAQEIAPNEATFIPVELKKTGSEDMLPAISCIYPVGEADLAGLLIFHIYAQSFFEIVDQVTPHSPSGQVMLVNADGYYLYHSQKKKEWNRLLASKDTENLKEDYGESTGAQILSRDSTPFREIGNEMVAYAPLFAEFSEMGSQYTILKSVPKAEFFSSIESFKKLFLGLLGFFLLVSLFLSFVATQQFTRPVQKLRREAEVIAKGNYQSRVDVKTYDEIEELAHQFNIMAESLEQREEEIARHHEKLEQMVRERTKELREEKDKLQVILDNVPSGFLLLDKDYQIQSASAALQSITGKPVETLIGQPYYEAIGDGFERRGDPLEEAFRSGKMGTRLVRSVGAEGEIRFLEHISVPLRKNKRVEAVLEIITDITQRKRLQDQLIRSERLAATGEIAAVIAHEMRNSLTSLRMILQLLAEGQHLPVHDRESLDVALDSLDRMEEVVSDLLQLSRPAQLDKRPQPFNSIVWESTEFARHQISRKGIELEVDLARDLPDIIVDRGHMKEAIVNLILNASQAIENSGKIGIASRLETLSTELRDLGEVAVVAAETVTIDVREVVLKKGTQVLRLDVTDTGCGMSPEHLDRIFDPFFTTKLSGTGLGLSMAKRVVSEHGGIILAENRKVAGVRISVILPIQEESQTDA